MPTYELFLFFEFLDAAFGSGSYICGFVLGIYTHFLSNLGTFELLAHLIRSGTSRA